MSKGNPFLGMMRGSVGDVTFYRQDGEQVARARNRRPKNPQTAWQLAQRVFAKTVQQAYSLMQPICDHSYQGKQLGTPNQSRFMQLNIAKMREINKTALDASSSIPLLMSQGACYAGKNTGVALLNEYIVSEGSIPSLQLGLFDGLVAEGEAGLTIGPDTSQLSSSPTYQDVIDWLGLEAGDQLTFLFFAVNDQVESGEIVVWDYARVILQPSDGSGLNSTFVIPPGRINLPNERNTGNLTCKYVSSNNMGNLYFQPDVSKINSASGAVNSLFGACCIVSRLINNTWARSTQHIVMRDIGSYPHDHEGLGDAILSYKQDASSSLYLNQSESF